MGRKVDNGGSLGPVGESHPSALGDGKGEARAAEAARRVARRAVRRLDALEMALLVTAVFLALGGGAVVAWLLRVAFGFHFRWVWVAASLLLFLVPGATAYRKVAEMEKGRNTVHGPEQEEAEDRTSKETHGRQQGTYP